MTPTIVRPSGDVTSETAATAITPLRGEPSAPRRPNHAGSAPSSAIAPRSRLAASVLPTRFVKIARKSVAPTTARPNGPNGSAAARNASSVRSSGRASAATQPPPSPGASAGRRDSST